MTRMMIWDFLSPPPRRENLIQRWAREDRLTVRDRARLNQKLDRLQQLEFDLAIHLHLLAGPVRKQRHIYKLVVYGDVMLRPMLCRGPLPEEMHLAYTLLLGAVEVGNRLQPDNAPAVAEERRQAVLEKPRERRQLHERFEE